MVAASFGHLAVEQLELSKYGVMMALANGKYTTVPIDICVKDKKRVEVGAFYDVDNYRPRITLGLDRPMFS
jgi:6-phosphofructokinase 1